MLRFQTGELRMWTIRRSVKVQMRKGLVQHGEIISGQVEKENQEYDSNIYTKIDEV